MAAVKLGKALLLVTPEEAQAALADWVTVGDEALTGKTMRAGESALIATLRDYQVYDETFAGLRHKTNSDLDRGEVTVMAERMPTKKRPSGRPSRSQDFEEWVTTLIQFTVGSGAASSVEAAVAHLTGRDRNGDAVGSGPARLALPNSKKSHWIVHEALRKTARRNPELVGAARHQGELSKAGKPGDPDFGAYLTKISAILADPKAVAACVRSVKRQKPYQNS